MGTKVEKEELFIEKYLPEPLSDNEIFELFKKVQEGDKTAIDKIIIHNIRLVLSRVRKKFDSVNYDKKDLVSIGNIGLIKAVNTFDINKKIKFNCYAVRCIDNEILMFLRQVKKDLQVESFEKPVTFNDSDTILLKDTLRNNSDLEEDYIDKELNLFIHEIIKTFPDRDREIIIMFFGFNGSKIHTQKEIGQKFNITQSNVSLNLNKNIKKLKKKLENTE